MFASPRNLILAVLAAVLVAAGLIFYAWRPVFKTASEATAPENAGKVSFLSSSGAGSGVFWRVSALPRQIFDNTLRASDDNQQQELLSPALSASASASTKLSPDELRKKHFALLYPEVYLDYLRKNQDWLLSEGVLKPEEKVEFKNEDEVFAFLRKLSDYLYQKKVIFEDPSPTFDAEIEILKKLHNGEAEALERGIVRPVGPASFLKTFSSLALELFGVKIAYAAGECYRDAGPNPIVGANDKTICCDCGVQRIGKVVFPVPDTPGCKSFGGQCNVANFGCLNGAGWGGNAIWDPASKICGYDAGSGGFGIFGIISKIFGVLGAISGIIENLPGLGDTNFTGGIIQNVPEAGPGASFPTPIIKDLPSGPELINI